MKWYWYWLKMNLTLISLITTFLWGLTLFLLFIDCFRSAWCVFILTVINVIMMLIADIYTYKHSKPIKS